MIPLVTKGRGEAENTSQDMNYFLGIDTSTGFLAADLEECCTIPIRVSPATTSMRLRRSELPCQGATVIQLNTWYHAAVTFDGRYWKFYLNGVQDGTTTDTGANRYPRWDSIQHAGIGTAMTSTGVAAGFFNGVIDEVARSGIVVRSQSDIQANMNLRAHQRHRPDRPLGIEREYRYDASNSIAGRPNPGTLTMAQPGWLASRSPTPLRLLRPPD